ncbi:MAG: response regulator transcription factor [Bryobacteraceae bacterium]|jgi:DNA-binding NarL/FixJ family response regulator
MKRSRVLLADDHVLILEGLRKILEPYHEVVGAVSDGRSLVDSALRLKPELIVLDVTMPFLTGVDAARQIHKRLPRTKLLFLTVHANPAYLREAWSAGATGYILKSSTREQILDAVTKALAGQTYISPGIVAEDFDLSRWRGGKGVESAAALTSREREILRTLAEGRTAKEAGAALGISHKTVAFHRNNVKRKLGVRKTVELIKRAIDEGLI